MSLQDKIAHIPIVVLFSTPVPVKGALWVFAALQLYFIANLLSFGFWRTSIPAFAYMILFYGLLIAIFLLLLLLSFRVFHPRFHIACLVIASVPFGAEIWLATVYSGGPFYDWPGILVVLAMLLYYRYGAFYPGRISALMLLLFSLAFIEHSDVAVTLKDNPLTPLAAHKIYESKAVVLDKKTNIHVIALDAFANAAFTAEFLGIENPADEYLSSLDNVIHAGNMGFSERVSTLPHWAGLFELDQSHGNSSSFSGHYPSLLTTILRKNGYAIQTGFSSAFWHARTGFFIDAHIIGNSTVPQSMPIATEFPMGTALICSIHTSLLGFCSKKSADFFQKIVPYSLIPQKAIVNQQSQASQDWLPTIIDQKLVSRDWPSMVIDAIRLAEQNAESPIFSGFYIFSPIGHTPTGRYITGNQKHLAKYRDLFSKRALKARKFLEELDHLRKEYPDSIFIVGGDHGPYLSRTETENRRFIVLDKHNVALALLNESNLCAHSRDWLKRQTYLTAARMIAASLACNGDSRKLLAGFKDRKEFMHFGKTYADTRSSRSNL